MSSSILQRLVQINEQQLSGIGAQITESVSNNQVIKGNAFTTRRVTTIGAGATLNIVFDASACSESAVVLLPPFFSATGGDGVTATSYAGCQYTGGTEQITRCRDFTSGNISQGKIYEGSTITTPGVEGFEWQLGSSSSFFAGNIQGSATDSLPVYHGPIISRVEFINNDGGSAQTLEYEVTWFEIPLSELVST